MLLTTTTQMEDEERISKYKLEIMEDKIKPIISEIIELRSTSKKDELEIEYCERDEYNINFKPQEGTSMPVGKIRDIVSDHLELMNVSEVRLGNYRGKNIEAWIKCSIE